MTWLDPPRPCHGGDAGRGFVISTSFFPEDVLIQERVAELAAGVVGLEQLPEVRQPWVERRRSAGRRVNSLPQWGRAAKGASRSSIRGSRVLTAGQSGFHVKWIATQACR